MRRAVTSCKAILSLAILLLASVALAQGTYKQVEMPWALKTHGVGTNTVRNIVGCQQQDRLHEGLIDISVVQVPGSNATYAEDINNLGQIVGAYRDNQSGSNEIGFLENSGTFSNIVFPGAAQTDAEGINDQGQIVGNYSTSNSSSFQAFLDTYGVFIPLKIPNAVSSAAYGIDNDGQIVGYFIDATGTQHGFMCSNELSCAAIDVPGASLTDFLGINNRGQVAGWYGASSEGGFVFDTTSGTFTTFGVPDSDSTTAIRINDRGQVVGHFSATGSPEQGFMYNDFSTIVLDVAKVSDTYLLGLNDRCQVVGLSDYGSFVARVSVPHEKDDGKDKMIAPATNALDLARATNAVYVAQRSAGAGNGTNCANAKAVVQIAPGTPFHLCQTN
jgi:probable HAF family extracellular repeat protein